MTSQSAVALHAEPWGGTDAGLRWVLPHVLVPTGRLLSAPGALGQLIDRGVLETAWCEPHALLVRLAPDRSWRECGPSVRTAICEAVTDLEAWRCDGDRDAVLRLIVDDVLAGQVGDYIRSHGGEVAVVSVADDRVTVRFAGACGHCPASSQTLNVRLTAAVRERYPDLSAVVADQGAGADRSRLWLWPRRLARSGGAVQGAAPDPVQRDQSDTGRVEPPQQTLRLLG